MKPLKTVRTKMSINWKFVVAILIVAGIGVHTGTVTIAENDIVGARAMTQSPIQQSLLEYTACYADVMGITPRWEVDVEFEYELPVDKDDRWSAVIDAEPDYLTASIAYNLAYLKDASDQEVRQTVIHELVHVSLWEMLELIPEEDEELSLRREEQLTTEVSKRPFWQELCRGSTAAPGKTAPAGLRRVN